MYIWEHQTWPLFQSDTKLIDSRLTQVLALQQQLVGRASELPEGLDKQAELDALVQSVIKSSEIEGESLNVGSVRSSVARQLGLEQAGLPKAARYEESVVEMLVSAVSDLEKPLTSKLLCQWQAALFPEPSLLRTIAIGSFRDDAGGPMQVVSERRGKTEVHFEAPPAKQLTKELNTFYSAFNSSPPEQHGMIRAAIAHLYLITIHPFDDGNGRVARALTDRALAQCENTSIRFYSLSAAIEKNKNGYYQILEQTQNCRNKTQQHQPLDITEWLLWFLDTLGQAIEDGLLRVERVLLKARFWQRHAQTLLSGRQLKVLNRLLDGYGVEFVDGLAARHYQAIGGVSKATATRDLADLVEKGCLQALEAGGRSVRYRVYQDGKA
ncbi:MAG: Fic family protein [Pseudomonadales bacterium]|nr:Fic family protein [Pseudomonadales bacterium]